MRLTAQDKQHYLDQGFLIIPDFITQESCDVLMQRARELIAGFDTNAIKTLFSTKDHSHAKQRYFLDSGDKIHFFYEEKALDETGRLTLDKLHSINKIGHALHDLDPIFHAFSHTNDIATLARDLEIVDPLLLQSMYICKQPLVGGEVSCHQDSSFLFVKEKPVTGLWFALENATQENGCLWAIPGGHKTALKSRMKRDAQDTVTFEVYDETPWSLENMIPLEVSRGSLIVLHGLLPHMSKENHSSHSRHAYTLHLYSKQHHYAEDNWLRRSQPSALKGIAID